MAIRQRVLETGLVALTVHFGMQCLRMWTPLLAFLVRDRLKWRSTEIAVLALVVFLTAFVAPCAIRRLGLRRMTWLASGGLALIRLEIQIWNGDPLFDLVAASAGVVLFLFAAPTLLALVRSSGDAHSTLGSGWLAGLLLDLVMFGVYGTWDIVWRNDLGSLILTTGLVLLAWWLIVKTLRAPLAETPMPGGLGSIAWIALWPLLFLHAWSFGNPGRLAELSGLTSEGAWMLLVSLLAAAWMAQTLGWWSRWPSATAVLPAAVLVVISLESWRLGHKAILLTGVGVFALAAALGISLDRAVAARAAPGIGPLTLGHGGALVGFVLLTFMHNSAWDLPLPLSADTIPLLAAVTVLVCLLLSARIGLPSPGGLRSLAAAGVVITAAFGLGLVWSQPQPGPSAQPSNWPLRVVTYNLHCGIDPSGRLDLEAMAATLEAEEPDVVILQEVSRGWLVNGSVDMMNWLARRLDMPYIFHGTADPTWGNAVMTRLPVTRVDRHTLPPETLLLRRGVLDVDIAVGGEALRILATHLHHPKRGGEERLVQSRRVVEMWSRSPLTLMAGDLNALPDEAEIVHLREAGFLDALDQAGEGDGFTYPSWDPVRRIDYVFLSPDLTATEARVSPSAASDHAAVIVVITPKADDG